MYFFQAGVLFRKENARFWPNFVANLNTFWCTFTGVNTVVVYINGQILGVYLTLSLDGPIFRSAQMNCSRFLLKDSKWFVFLLAVTR